MWAAEVSSWHTLTGREVTGWAGVEMAFRGGEDGEPAVFDDAALPFRQWYLLDLVLADGTRRTARTYPDDVSFELDVRTPLPRHPGGARRRPTASSASAVSTCRAG